MTCGCNDKCELPKALQINNPGEVTLFHRVEIPASQGDDTTYPPKNGLYRNVLLVYLANNHSYLYNSDGIPTRVDGPAGPGTAAGGETGQILAKRSDADYDTTWITQTSANDATLTISRNDTPVGTFTANASVDKTIDIEVPTKTSDLTNDGATGDSTYVEATALSDYYTKPESDSIFQDKLTAGSNITIDANNEISATDTTYSDFTGATSSVAGAHGLVPAPTTSDPGKFLKGDGTWGTPPGATYTGGTGIDITDNVVSVDNTIATVTDLGEKVDIASIDLTGQTTTLLALTKALGTNNIDYARWECRTDIGSANISDKPTGYNASFVCEAYCNRWTASNDYRYQLICWVKENTNPFVAYIANNSSSITWERLRPTVNDATLTIQKNGTTVETFTANSSTNKTANITVPTKTSDITNDGADGTSTYVEADELAPGYITGEGTEITLANTQGGRFSDVKLKGNTEQTTYSGKNLFNALAIANTNIVVSNNGQTITMPVVSTGNGLVMSNTTLAELCPTLAVGDTVYLQMNTTSSVNKYIWLMSSDYLWFPTGARTITATDLRSNVGLYGNRIDQGETIQVVISDLRIVRNSTDAFEPYVGGTASPSPSYPQAVQTVTGEQTINITGKNLCSGISQGYWLNAATDNAGVTSNDPGLIIPVSQNTDYTISTTATQARYRIAFSDQVWGGSQFACYNGQNSDNTSASITKNSGTHKYLVVNATDLTKIQVERGSTATAYESYHGQTYTINLGKNLFDKSNAAQILDGYFINTGAQTIGQGSGYAVVYIKCQPNTTYTVSKTITSRFTIASTSRVPADGVSTSDTIEAPSSATNTFTTNSSARYLAVMIRSSSDTLTTQQIINTIQIEVGSTATTYAPYFTPVELCKIGTYQDYIYKNNGTWYLHKEVRHVSLNVSDMNNQENYAGWNNVPELSNLATDLGSGLNTGLDQVTAVMTNFITPSLHSLRINTAAGGKILFLPTYAYPNLTQTQWQAQYPNLVCEIYYGILNQPTDTPITGTLLDDLNAFDQATSCQGDTYITVSSVSPNLPAILSVTTEERNILPTATEASVGVVSVGDGLSITNGGVLSLADNVVYSEDPGTPIGEVVDPYTYSTAETRIGTWIDGKPLYRKVVNFGALPNATTKAVAHGLSNFRVRNFYSAAVDPSNNITFYLPTLSGSTSAFVTMYIDENNIVISTMSTDRSAFTECYVTIEYTKTTD